jgi:hypothetical protein
MRSKGPLPRKNNRHNNVISISERQAGAAARRPRAYAGYRLAGAGLRGCTPNEFWRLCNARAQRDLRHQ